MTLYYVSSIFPNNIINSESCGHNILLVIYCLGANNNFILILDNNFILLFSIILVVGIIILDS